MSHIITHDTRLEQGSVQTYALSANRVALDLQREAVELLTPLQAIALVRILEAAIRDATEGAYVSEASA